MADNNTGDQGLGSPKMSEEKKHEIQSKGGKASAESRTGSAGKTDAAKRGGEHSHRNS